MPKWISVEKAVIKYHIEKEAILLFGWKWDNSLCYT